jgi:hypothetical protein
MPVNDCLASEKSKQQVLWFKILSIDLEARASGPDGAMKGTASASQLELRDSPCSTIPTNLRDYLEAPRYLGRYISTGYLERRRCLRDLGYLPPSRRIFVHLCASSM